MVCSCCNGRGRPVTVAYIPVRQRSVRRYYLACTKCDLIALWPNFTKSSPVVSKE